METDNIKILNDAINKLIEHVYNNINKVDRIIKKEQLKKQK